MAFSYIRRGTHTQLHEGAYRMVKQFQPQLSVDSSLSHNITLDIPTLFYEKLKRGLPWEPFIGDYKYYYTWMLTGVGESHYLLEFLTANQS